MVIAEVESLFRIATEDLLHKLQISQHCLNNIGLKPFFSVVFRCLAVTDSSV